MNTPPTALSLAFRHPLVIGSILLLLVNDHLLKAAAPSWLTGKLSDFAGLFFFPFLLAVILRRGLREEKRALGWGMLLTGIVFVAIKTIPAANAAFTWVVSQVLGSSVRFVIDPTDLIALMMLPAGWWFWQRLRAQSAPQTPGRLAYAMMALGSLAALATSPCPAASGVYRLAVLDGKAYAGVGFHWISTNPMVYVLSDDQKTWNFIKEPDSQVLEAILLPQPKLPFTLCNPSAPLVCYQINEAARILESRDGGQTWQMRWQYPPGREEYMERAGIEGICMARPEITFYDLAILPGPDGPTVIAAAGNQGVVMRRGNQAWQRMGVDDRMGPTPTQSVSLDQAFNIIGPEFIAAGAASLLVYTILSVLARRYSPVAADGRRSHPGWALHPALFVLPWLLAGLAIWLGMPENSIGRQTILFFEVLALIIMLLTLLLGATGESGARRKAGLLSLLAVFAALALPVIFFLLWAYGIIPRYTTTLILTLAVTLTVFGVLFYRIWQTILRQQET